MMLINNTLGFKPLAKAISLGLLGTGLMGINFSVNAQTQIDEEKSLFVVETAVLQQFKMEDVLQKLMDDVGDLRTPTQFAIDNNLSRDFHEIEALAITNRFDLADGDNHCGEYRVAFRDPGTAADAVFTIFEARLKNPEPANGIEACRPVVEFWASLTNISSAAERAQKLHDFYFTGLANFGPVISVDNYAGQENGSGQIRTNSRNSDARFWTLREKITEIQADGSLAVVETTTKDNPITSLAADANGNALNELFQTAVLDSLILPNAPLLNTTMTSLGINIPIESESQINQTSAAASPLGPSNGVTTSFDNTSTFASQIQQRLDTAGSNLTPDQVMARVNALSCAGCHDNRLDLGGELSDFQTVGQNIEFLSEEKASFTPALKLEAEHFSFMSGIQTEATTDEGGGLNVGWLDPGDWMTYEIALPASETNEYDITFRIAGMEFGSFQLEQPGGANVYETVSFGPTGGWQTWQNVVRKRIKVDNPQAGLAIAVISGGWNLNWIDVKPVGDDKFVIKDSIKTFFLPDRKKNMEDFLNQEPCTTCGINLINNGDFDNGSTHWANYQHTGTSSTVALGDGSGSARTSILNGGDQSWHVQFYQSGLNIEQGKTFSVSFDSTTMGKITNAQFEVVLEEDGGDYTSYMPVKTVSVNPLVQRFTFEFTMPQATDSNARLTFNMGNNHSPGGGFPVVIDVDNVEVKQVN